MKKLLTIGALAVIIFAAVSCHKNTVTPAGTVTLDLPAGDYHYFSTRFSDSSGNARATLGRVLFYDGHLSLNNTISCASCHKQSLGFADNVAASVGYAGRLTKRNSKGILNIAGIDSFYRPELVSNPGKALFWDGRVNILKSLVSRPITNHVEMGIDDLDALAAKLSALSFYPPLFQKAYGSPEVTPAKISESISAFMAAIRSNNSKFDQYLQNNPGILNAQEYQGMVLFNTKYNCSGCHHPGTQLYTFSDIIDIGLDQTYSDIGAGAVNNISSNDGKFVVPSLSNVALTAPYMHDGRFKTLDEVLDHYSHGIKNSPNLDPIFLNADSTTLQMNIPSQEKAAIIAFLNTLTDYTTINDVKFSNPFKVK